MDRTWEEDLERALKDPECATYFAEAQVESAQELLRAGIISQLTIGTQMSRTEYVAWQQ